MQKPEMNHRRQLWEQVMSNICVISDRLLASILTIIVHVVELYQSAVGKLLYLSIRTRPDIVFALSTAAKFTAKLTEQHWKAYPLIRILLAPSILDYNLLEKG